MAQRTIASLADQYIRLLEFIFIEYKIVFHPVDDSGKLFYITVNGLPLEPHFTDEVSAVIYALKYLHQPDF